MTRLVSELAGAEFDRELLVLAAKAAGIDGSLDPIETLLIRTKDDERGISVWMPLTDDGDALRLAVKLGLYLEIDRPNQRASALPEPDNMPFQRERFGEDPCAALRRVIVRAAAEIGRATP